MVGDYERRFILLFNMNSMTRRESERVIGELATQLGLHEKLFLATKVWTRGKQAGIESMRRSLARLQTKRIDLMQVHNLIDVATQLATMRDWKTQGRFRYIGITHY